MGAGDRCSSLYKVSGQATSDIKLGTAYVDLELGQQERTGMHLGTALKRKKTSHTQLYSKVLISKKMPLT